jgi:hypothetical protein
MTQSCQIFAYGFILSFETPGRDRPRRPQQPVAAAAGSRPFEPIPAFVCGGDPSAAPNSNAKELSMADRTTRRIVTFKRPFRLGGIESIPPGRYEVETEEELLMDVSFPAYRRIGTFIFLPAIEEGRRPAQMARIEPSELAAAEQDDAAAAAPAFDCPSPQGPTRS